MLTIRPSPAGSMAVNAARQQRNEPVRLTPSVCSQISAVVSANSARVSTPAAQTSAATGPAALGHGEKALDIGALAHVRGHRCSLTARVPDVAGDAVESVAVTGGQDDLSASRRYGRGRGRPDPAARARDDRHPSA